jgi:hypothetical protein
MSRAPGNKVRAPRIKNRAQIAASFPFQNFVMFRVLYLVAVLSFAATCVSAADEDDDTNVVTMGADFKEEVAKNNHLVMFYAPW